ncbi:MAG: hypothetical protein U0930_20885 [Pirellulales bacterium]
MVPIIFTLFLGSIEMTRLNFLRHTAANAAYRSSQNCHNPGWYRDGRSEQGYKFAYCCGANNNVTIKYESTSTYVNVTITIPVDKNSWGLGRFSSGLNLVKSCKLSREIL